VFPLHRLFEAPKKDSDLGTNFLVIFLSPSNDKLHTSINQSKREGVSTQEAACSDTKIRNYLHGDCATIAYHLAIEPQLFFCQSQV
jgi:hypothetical protein